MDEGSQFSHKAKKRDVSADWLLLFEIPIAWFIVAQAIALYGTALGMSPPLQRYLIVGFFVFSGLWVLVDGLAWNFWASMILIVAGIGIFATLPEGSGVNLTDIVQNFKTVDQSVRALTGTGDAAFMSVQPHEHLSKASELIFHGPTNAALAIARLHLEAIPKEAPEYPSARALLKVSDTRLMEKRRNERSPGPHARPIEMAEVRKTKVGWSVTLRNVDTNPVGNIRYQMFYFDGNGQQVPGENKFYTISRVFRPGETWTLNIEKHGPSKLAAYAAFELVSWETQGPQSH